MKFKVAVPINDVSSFIRYRRYVTGHIATLINLTGRNYVYFKTKKKGRTVFEKNRVNSNKLCRLWRFGTIHFCNRCNNLHDSCFQASREKTRDHWKDRKQQKENDGTMKRQYKKFDVKFCGICKRPWQPISRSPNHRSLKPDYLDGFPCQSSLMKKPCPLCSIKKQRNSSCSLD